VICFQNENNLRWCQTLRTKKQFDTRNVLRLRCACARHDLL